MCPHAPAAETTLPGDAGGPTLAFPEEYARAIDTVVTSSIDAGKLPGCVVAVGRHDGVAFLKAYGSRALLPERVPMTPDTVFDLASLTKPLATATSVMLLAERGTIDLDAPAARYFPELARNGKGTITVRQLLTHTSGLPADTPVSDFAHGRDEALRRIEEVALRAPPGERFLYSDVGYLALEEIVRRVTQTDYAAFTRASIFEPLGMHETGFLPDPALRARAAPTEQRDGAWIVGDVHDPRAALLGGVAGHAGVFSTAADLSRYARMILGRGEVDGHRLLTPHAVDRMLARHDVPRGLRALGWDVASPLSSNRGALLSPRAIGHGGYTGTAMWIDPDQDIFVVFLSNRVHPDGKGAVNPLVAQIDDLAVRAMTNPLPDATPACGAPADHVLAGVDVLAQEDFRPLRGARVGLLTHGAARTSSGKTTADLLAHAPGVTLVRLFAPEHGLTADREGKLEGGIDPETSVPVVSLFGDSFAPPPESLADIDTLVVDLVDVGTRFYTYASTLHRAMIAAAEHELRVVVLDRPDPIDGVDVEGPPLASGVKSFVHHLSVPVRHGLTLGELALYMDATEHLGTRLTIVPVRGWRRSDMLDATGLAWANPSPNLRSVTEALLYPGVGLLEGTNLSVGRGTDTPFEVVGAPWMDADAAARALAQEHLGGVAFAATTFTPHASLYTDKPCRGLRLTVTDRSAFDPLRTGFAIARTLARLSPEWHADDLERVVGNPDVVAAVRAQKSLDEIEALTRDDVSAFLERRKKVLLYPTACVPPPPPVAPGTEAASAK